MGNFDKQKYDNDYAKQNYDRCIFNVPKGQKAVIEAHWKKKGYKSLNAYVNELIRRDMAGEESGGVNFNGNVITGSNCISIKTILIMRGNRSRIRRSCGEAVRQ